MMEVSDERNSLLFWFPKVKNLGIPIPITKWVEFPHEMGRKLLSEETEKEGAKQFQPYLKKLKTIAKGIGYPVFIRTDMASHKHGWKKGSFVRLEKDLHRHIIDVLEFNELAGMFGLNYKAIVIREFLELDWRFKAFYGEMPVARERRYFVEDGKVVCRHPYWIEDAIVQAHKGDGRRDFLGYTVHKLPNKWESMLSQLNKQTKQEIILLTDYAERVSKVLEGYWSVDFACTRGGSWHLIDMALGKASYHLENCPTIAHYRAGNAK